MADETIEATSIVGGGLISDIPVVASSGTASGN